MKALIPILLWPIIQCLAIVENRPGGQEARLKGVHGEYPVQNFYSSKAQSPYVDFLQWNSECDDGRNYMITPRGWKVHKPGPMVLDGQGRLIWMKHFPNDYGGQAYDLKVQRYKNEDYLTFWLGDDRVRGHGAGHFWMLNSSYDVVRKVGATNNLHADLHELIITPEGTALMLTFQPAPGDLKPLGRMFNDRWNQAVWDCVFQETDFDTGKLIFEWRASDHVEVDATYNKLTSVGDLGTKTNPFDWFHINSVQKDPLGNFLISARNVHAIYYINGKTKDIIWTLGGKDNSFQDLSGGHALNFAWQHDARFVSGFEFPDMYEPPEEKAGWTTQLMTLFDNAALDGDYSYGPPYSRALLLEVTYPTPGKASPQDLSPNHGKLKSRTENTAKLSKLDAAKIREINGTNPLYTVRLVHQYINPHNILSSTQGSVQVLPQSSHDHDPKIFIGYGINAVMTEFHSNGTVLCDMRFGAETTWEKGDVQSYRAYKQAWVGKPRTPPSAVVRKNTVYVSWNGATEVVEWVLQAASTASGGKVPKGDAPWAELARKKKEGFETAISLEGLKLTRAQNRLRVVALDKSGAVLEHGISGMLKRGLMSNVVSPAVKQIESSSGVVKFFFIALMVAVLWVFFRSLCPSKYRRRQKGSLLPRQRMD